MMTPAERKAEANRLWSGGLENMAEIARRLEVSPSTVAAYLGRRRVEDYKAPHPRIHRVSRRKVQA